MYIRICSVYVKVSRTLGISLLWISVLLEHSKFSPVKSMHILRPLCGQETCFGSKLKACESLQVTYYTHWQSSGSKLRRENNRKCLFIFNSVPVRGWAFHRLSIHPLINVWDPYCAAYGLPCWEGCVPQFNGKPWSWLPRCFDLPFRWGHRDLCVRLRKDSTHSVSDVNMYRVERGYYCSVDQGPCSRFK